ncbi:MAG: SulP family inorganic anion transporter [Chloroflexi bacterium]|nr:SulP family inorganic anion transporter [Chloroflexota bacterium]
MRALPQQNTQNLAQSIYRELLAGLSGALVGAPQAMAFALIAGVEPIYGLYAAIVATLVGALLDGHGVMTIAPTNALALVVGSTLAPFVDGSGGELARLFSLTALVGLFQLGFGVLRLGRLMRYYDAAVLTGFISGAGLLIVLNQLPTLTGLTLAGGDTLSRSVEWLRSAAEFAPKTTLMGALALALMLAFWWTRWRRYGTLVGLVVVSVLVAALGWEEVTRLQDIATLPRRLPFFVGPDWGYWPALAPGALAIAVLGLAQSAAMARGLPEDQAEFLKRLDSDSQDFLAQGLANLAGGFFQCMPAGGSLSRTALLLGAGGRTRWSNVISALVLAGLLVSVAGLAEQIALVALSAQLVVAGLRLINWRSIRRIWGSGWAGQAALSVTFAATLILPLTLSVFLGMAISALLFVRRRRRKVRANGWRHGTK